MTLREFHNGIRILFNLDAADLIGAGVLNIEQWPSFRDDPPRWFIRADDETADKLWALIKPRMTNHRPHVHVVGTTVGLGIDTCAACGHDLRDTIHVRANQ